MRFEHAERIYTEHRIEERTNSGVLDYGAEHGRGAVGQDRQAARAQLLQRAANLRVDSQPAVLLHQLGAGVLREVEPEAGAGKTQRGVRNRLEVLVAPHQTAKPGVFELLA